MHFSSCGVHLPKNKLCFLYRSDNIFWATLFVSLILGKFSVLELICKIFSEFEKIKSSFANKCRLVSTPSNIFHRCSRYQNRYRCKDVKAKNWLSLKKELKNFDWTIPIPEKRRSCLSSNKKVKGNIRGKSEQSCLLSFYLKMTKYFYPVLNSSRKVNIFL